MCVKEDAVVLIIDDCNDNLFLMELILVNDGYKVVTACNGKEGIAKATEVIPNLIILDMMMPDMSGAEVIEHLKANCKLAEIPIILCTANKSISKEDVRGIVDICYKPFDIGEMIVRVSSFVKCCQYEHNSTAIGDPSQTNFSAEDRQWQSVSNAKSSIPKLFKHQEVPVFKTQIFQNMFALTQQNLIKQDILHTYDI